MNRMDDQVKNLPKIGVIGLGMMGKGLATHALRAGYTARLLIRNQIGRERCAGLIADGAAVFASSREVAQEADIVVICATGSSQVEEIVFGAEGVLGSLKPGTVVIDCSTSLPASSRKIAAAIADAGGHFLDAAMTGTPKEANEGAVNLLIGGSRDVLETVREFLASFSKNVYYCGDTGAGHTIKLLHQFVVLGNAAILAEAFSCAKNAEVDLETLCDVIGSGGANSTAFQRFKPFVLEGKDDGFQFSLSNALKDMDYYTRTALDSRSVAPIAGAVLASYTVACNQGAGSAFVPNLLGIVDGLNGVHQNASSWLAAE